MAKRVKLGHHYYYVVAVDDLLSGNMRGKNVVVDGRIDDKPTIEFLPAEMPSWRTSFSINGLNVEFPGSPCIGMGDHIRVYGRFVGDCIMASAVETEKAVYTTEE